MYLLRIYKMYLHTTNIYTKQTNNNLHAPNITKSIRVHRNPYQICMVMMAHWSVLHDVKQNYVALPSNSHYNIPNPVDTTLLSAHLYFICKCIRALASLQLVDFPWVMYDISTEKHIQVHTQSSYQVLCCLVYFVPTFQANTFSKPFLIAHFVRMSFLLIDVCMCLTHMLAASHNNCSLA